jgi:late competence protein required for DNA uptake (superfamily II DNA/RNA helicase)
MEDKLMNNIVTRLELLERKVQSYENFMTNNISKNTCNRCRISLDNILEVTCNDKYCPSFIKFRQNEFIYRGEKDECNNQK